MTTDKSHTSDHGVEKQSVKPGDKPPPGTPITEKADNSIQQRLQEREAFKTFRLTRDPNNAFAIDMGNGSEVKDKRPMQKDEPPSSTINSGLSAALSKAELDKVPDTPIPTEAAIAYKIHNPLDHLRHPVGQELGKHTGEIQEATSRQFHPHEGKEDQFVDYAAARDALHLAHLDKYKLPENILGAILRNEQHFYKLTDAMQDDEIAKTGTVRLKNGKEDSYASIGPAQMQIRHIRRLIEEKDAHGDPKYPFLQHMKDDPIRAALDKKNAALLTGAYFADEIEKRHLKPNEVTAESLAYMYNPDVHSFGNPKQYVACEDKLSLNIQKILHKDLKDEQFPSSEVIKHSIHVQHVMSNLARIPKSKTDDDAKH
ncbi:MAG TPA: hypothetical protein V6C86_25420 [Oculatellaceae cyanobacterium]